jgi:hypothetical protein
VFISHFCQYCKIETLFLSDSRYDVSGFSILAIVDDNMWPLSKQTSHAVSRWFTNKDLLALYAYVDIPGTSARKVIIQSNYDD